MEVHAHSHTPRKKWTHYFWEFLMLFLAVFCGFLAENEREHYIEKHRAKEFAKSLIEDLQADTLTVNYTIFVYDSLSRNIDTFRKLVRMEEVNKIPGGKLYYYGDAAISGYRMPFNTTTIEQLKSSGSLRYFPEKLRTLISKYDLQTQSFNLRQSNEPIFNIETNKYFVKIFDNNVLEQLYNIHSADLLKQFISADFALLNNDPKLLKEYANNCFGRRNNWKTRITGSLIPLRQLAVELMIALKEKYNIR